MGFYFATDRGTDLHECQEDGIITERYDEGRQMVLSDKDDLEKASVRKMNIRQIADRRETVPSGEDLSDPLIRFILNKMVLIFS